jgi:cytochrome b561
MYETVRTAHASAKSAQKHTAVRRNTVSNETKTPGTAAGHSGLIYNIVIIALVAVIILILSFLYRKNDFFRSLFEGNVTAQTQIASENDIREAAKNVESINRTAAHLSFFILMFILILQAVAFMTAAKVFAGLKRSAEAVSVRMKKLENADLFLDLPLYFGLLGTVASFIVMSFNPNISRLIAYSSTLVGIIFSVILRLIFQYPLKQSLITASAELNGKESEQ